MGKLEGSSPLRGSSESPQESRNAEIGSLGSHHLHAADPGGPEVRGSHHSKASAYGVGPLGLQRDPTPILFGSAGPQRLVGESHGIRSYS